MFRPFSTLGSVFNADTLGSTGSTDKALVDEAIGPQWSVSLQDGTAVPLSHLQGLLSASLSQPGACAQLAAGPAKQVKFSGVDDLAGHLMANGEAVASGFARHAHRAFSNRASVGIDVIAALRKDWKENRRTPKALTRAYFLSESFACRAN